MAIPTHALITEEEVINAKVERFETSESFKTALDQAVSSTVLDVTTVETLLVNAYRYHRAGFRRLFSMNFVQWIHHRFMTESTCVYKDIEKQRVLNSLTFLQKTFRG